MKKPNKIYMDYASGALPNPSGMHFESLAMKKKLEGARVKVGNLLGARGKDVIFTSGGTESNNLAIQGIVLSFERPHIVTTNIEHSSVLETFRLLQKRKLAEITIVPVEESGIVDPKNIKKAIKKNTVLVSVMYVNNEIGTIQPIKEIAKVVRYARKENGNKIFFHTDAVQAVSYLDLNVERLGVDMLTLSGAKIKGAGRVGVLYKRNTVPLRPILGGGDQEFGLRPGTENVEAIIKFANALESVQKMKDKEWKRLSGLQKYFLKLLSKEKVVLNGSSENRLPSNVNITIPNIPSDLLILELSQKGILVSGKSACKSGDGKASYVIQAVNPNIKDTDGSIRFSFGKDTTKEDVVSAGKNLFLILKKLKKWYY